MTRSWRFHYLRPARWWQFDLHRSTECHRLSITVGRLAFRWDWS